ncbi:hypothetical protein EBB07_29460 [Paenibacillaceae bacterium]|nr:hypothetical protein EBB07_29460 [Paenibacillaceae bacterium]
MIEEMLYGIIYKITNKINNKCYIGLTRKTLGERITQHLYTCRAKKRKKHKIHYAINKYGVDNFLFEEIDQAFSLDELNKKEILHIKTHDSIANGYNILEGGGIDGHLIWLGRTHSEETKRKISKAHMGKTFSKETRLKISKTRKDRKLGQLPGKDHHSSVEIVQLDKDTLELIDIYDAAAQAEIKYSKNKTRSGAIHNVVSKNKSSRTAYGFKWLKKIDYDQIKNHINENLYLELVTKIRS